MRERDGRVFAKPIDSTGAATLKRVVLDKVEEGATIYTDEFPSYTGLEGTYEHGFVKHKVGEYVNGSIHTNGIESVWAVLKRGYNGVYHHWSKKHMRRYVNEFVFRLNEGNVQNHTMDRLDQIIQNSVDKRTDLSVSDQVGTQARLDQSKVQHQEYGATVEMTVALCLGISPHFWSSQLPFSKLLQTDNPLPLRADHSVAAT